jgi:hypothetical protein
MSQDGLSPDKATTEEIDAMSRLMCDHDGKIFFAFLTRRLSALDAVTRKMFGDALYHANGRRTELANLIDLAKASETGEAKVTTTSAGPARPPAPLVDGWPR